MKKFAFPFLLQCFAFVMLCGSGALAQAGSQTNAADAAPSGARLAPPVVVRSVFIDEPRTGKDPFFPNSTRRAPAAEVAVTNAPPPSTLFSQLSLKGISGVRGQRFALINSATVGVGEKAEIRAGSQSVKIRCREIRDASVLIELVGGTEVRELKLREGI